MKNFIKKSLSIFLMLIMLVPLIGTMTSAEESAPIENLYSAPVEKDLYTNYSVSLPYKEFNPGDIVTLGPVSINETGDIVRFRSKNENGYVWTDIRLNDCSRKLIPGTNMYIVRFRVPDISYDRMMIYVSAMFRESTVVTVNNAFTPDEYLEYINSKGIDISVIYPTEYSGEFVNVFPKSDSVFAGRLLNEKVDGKTTVVEKPDEKYYTSSSIAVNEGDIITLAGSVSNAFFSVWFFDATNAGKVYSTAYTVRYYYNKSEDCRINALVVPKGATSMRVVAYKNAYENGNIVVTVNQPMCSYNAYKSCTRINISGLETEYTYTGSTIKPVIELKIGGNVLKLGKDYKLTYGNKNVGNKKLTVTFIGNYAYLGKVYYTYKILPKPVDVIWSNTELVYNGEIQAPSVEVTGVSQKDTCTVSISGLQSDCGTYTAKAILSNKNYTIAENATCEYTISPKPVDLVWESTSAIYNGNYQAPVAKAFGIVNGDVCDVIVSGAGKDAGTYVVTAAISNPNYLLTSNTVCNFTIAPKPVELVWGNTAMYYTGKRQTPTVEVVGLVNNDVCNVIVSGYGEELGLYAATAAALSNPNYVLPQNTTCYFSIINHPVMDSMGTTGEFVIDVMAIIPDSAKDAVADAAEEAVNKAEEAISEAIEDAFANVGDIFSGLFDIFKNFGW